MCRPSLVRDVTGFDFDAWRAENARASAILRATLAGHIATGGIVEETAPGFVAVWSLTRHPSSRTAASPRITSPSTSSAVTMAGLQLRMVAA
jgi:hypothetical protein